MTKRLIPLLLLIAAPVAAQFPYYIMSNDIDTLAELNSIVADETIISESDISTSAELAAILTDGTGSGAVCFATSPTLVSPTINTSVGLPASAVDAITEIAAGLKAGADGTLLTGTSGASGNCAEWDANGDLIDSGGACGGAGAETNSLETTITGIADTEIFVGNGADSGTFAAMSGDATMSNTGAVTVADNSHDHTEANISDLAHTTSAADLSSGTLPAARLGADSIDAITEIASGIKSGLDASLITGTATTGECAEFDANGDIVGAGAACGAGGSGDITSVGDVASGAAFDGTQGTTLTFNNAGGDATLDYDGTGFTLDTELTTEILTIKGGYSVAGDENTYDLGICDQDDTGRCIGMTFGTDEEEMALAGHDVAGNWCPGLKLSFENGLVSLVDDATCGSGSGAAPWLVGQTDPATQAVMGPDKNFQTVGLGGDQNKLFFYVVGSPGAGTEEMALLNAQNGMTGIGLFLKRATVAPTSAAASNGVLMWYEEVGADNSQIGYVDDVDADPYYLVADRTTQTLTGKTIDTASNTLTVVEADISDLAHTTSAADLSSGTIPAARVGAAHIDALTELGDLCAGDEILERNTGDTAWACIPTPSGGGSLSNVVEDTTPQLGGQLDTNGNAIVSVSNADIDITPNGTGEINLNAPVVVAGANSLIQGNGSAELNIDGNGQQTCIGDGAGNEVCVSDAGAMAAAGTGSITATAMATAGLSDVSVTATELAELETIDATTISAAQWAGLGGATTAGIALWDDADAAAQLVTLGLTATASEINTPLDGALVTLTEFQELETIDSTTISAGQWADLGGDGFLLNDGDVGTGVFDFGGATSLEIPNGASPTVNAAGEIAEDTTDGQIVSGASGYAVAQPTKSACMVVEDLAAADDDFPIPIAAGQTVELISAFGHCQGACTTEADLSFEYVQVGTAGPTITDVTGTVTTEDYITGDSATTLSGSTTVTALDVLRFDVDNAVSPETDTYTICVNYRLGRT